MKLDIFNINAMIKTNDLQEVKNTISFHPDGLPTEDGLFSFELFGKPASPERKKRFAYVDLKTDFIHPIVFRNLIALQKNLGDLIFERKKFIIDGRKRLVPDEGGRTGIAFLKSVWGNFIPGAKDSDEGSSTRKERIKFIKLVPKNEVFLNKWIVIPAFYRDINFQSDDRRRISKDDVNDTYVKLIGLSKAIDQGNSLELTGGVVRNAIQTTLNQLYDYFKEKMSSKSGIIKDKLMAKTVDYSVRSVITSTTYDAPDYDSVKIKMHEIGVPIGQLCVLFYPFLVREMNIRLTEVISSKDKIEFELAEDADAEFFPKEIERIISSFIKSPEFRLTDVTLKGKGKKRIPLPLGLFTKSLKRNVKWVDLIYTYLYKFILPGKHIIVTRYPADNYQNLIIARPVILTTTRTIRVKMSTDMYHTYPDSETGNGFHDAVVLPNQYLKTMNADFDGDTVSIRSIFSNEANKELEGIINKKINLLDATADAVRVLKNEGIQGIYDLTK